MITTGSNNASIDEAACRERNIRYACTRGGLGSTSTSELAWTLIFALAKQLPREASNVRHGEWQTEQGRHLAGTTLGLLGFGKSASLNLPRSEERTDG